MATKLFIIIALTLSVVQINTSLVNKLLDENDVSAVLQEANDVIQLSEAAIYEKYYQNNILSSQTENLLKDLIQRDDEFTLCCILENEDDLVNAMNGTHYAAKGCIARAQHSAIIIALKIHEIKEQIHAKIEAANFIINSCAQKPISATEKLACISNDFSNNGQEIVRLVKDLKLAINVAKSEIKIIYEVTKACLADVLESGYDEMIEIKENIIECVSGKNKQ